MKAPVIIIAAAAVFAASACKSSRNIARNGEVSVPEDTTVYTVAEDMPLFDGKTPEEGFFEYVKANFMYPVSQSDYQGRVIVQFVVEKDGSVSNAEVLRSLDSPLDAEALRVVRSSSGRWTPGKMRGTPVRVKYLWPIVFKLETDETSTRRDTAVYTIAEDMPLFDGKPPEESFHEYVKANLEYPSSRFDGWGRVFVTFVIEKDGSVSHATVVRGVHPDLDAEAIRIVRSSSGRWTPGKMRGTPVRVGYALPVLFKM